MSEFHQVAQPFQDHDRAVAFYRDVLKLPLLGQFPGLAFFDLGGGTRLYIGGSGTERTLYIGVADLEAEVARLEAAGATIESAPHLLHRHDGNLGLPAGTEEWMAFFRDPEGNLVALSERRPPA